MSSRHRGSTTPMDFEYQNGHGPVDNFSPFVTSTPAGRKRPQSVLDSPTKTPFSQSKPLPAVPPRVQSAWEPRTPYSDYEFSSGGETPNTPAQDSDTATPDTQMASKMGRLLSGDTPRSRSPKKSRREGLFGFLRASPSPAKDRKYYAHKTEHKISKQRNKRRELALRNDFDSDEAASRPQSQQGPNAQQALPPKGWWHHLGLFGSWLEAHPDLPSVLSYWFQLMVNSVLGIGFLYILYTVYSGVMADVSLEAQSHKSSIMSEIAVCAKEFRDNRCERPIPAMISTCSNWESCMNRDPNKVARAAVSARTWAKIFNSFVEEFSYKSMLFTTMIIFGGFNLSNWAFGVIRGAQHPSHHQTHPTHQDWLPPPATPQRQLSGGYVDQAGYNNTPFRTPYANGALQHSQSYPALMPASGMGMNDDFGPATTGANVRGEGSPEKIRSPRKRGLFS